MVGVLILFAIFYIIWFAGLGAVIGQMGTASVEAYGHTGLLAFFLENLNIFIFIGSVLGLVGVVYWGGGQ